MMTVLTTNGSPSQPSEPLAVARPALSRGRLSVVLVLTQNKSKTSHSDQTNQDSDLQQATTHLDYLKVNGHQIWISDFAFTLDFTTFATPTFIFRHFNPKFYRDNIAKLSNILTLAQLSV